MNILILSQYYHPDITAAAFRIKETADILASYGYNITVITAKPHRVKSIKSDNIHDGSIKTLRLPIIEYQGKGKINYIVHYLSLMIMAMIVSIFRAIPKYDVVIASSPPLFVGAAGYLASTIKSAKFIFDVRDIWPDSAVAAGQLKKNGLLYKFGKMLEEWLYRQANLITCVSKPMAEYISNYTNKKKVIVIYNGVPQKYLVTHSIGLKDKRRKICFQENKINIVYLGNLGRVQGLHLLIDVAKRLKTELPDVMFYLIGDGVEKKNLTMLTKKASLKNIIIMDAVPKDDALAIARESSALFFQLKDDSSMEKTVPSKLFDYMTAGKPILFGIKGEGKEILEQVK
jgi:glycosyltransferase involved in cell wall biosynthesis